MWLIHDDETAASKSFLKWQNRVFSARWTEISTLEQFFHIATEIAIATEPAFWILVAITERWVL